MHPLPKTKEVLEAHDQRAPALGIDPVPVPGEPHRVGHVHPQDPHLERHRPSPPRRIAHRQRMYRRQLRLEVDRALRHARGCHQLARDRREAGVRELVLHMPVAVGGLPFRHGVRPRGPRQPVHRPDLFHRRQAEDALAGALDVGRRVRARAEAEQAAPAQPPGAGHRGEVGGAVGIGRADQHDGGAEVEDGGIDRAVHAALLEERAGDRVTRAISGLRGGSAIRFLRWNRRDGGTAGRRELAILRPPADLHSVAEGPDHLAGHAGHPAHAELPQLRQPRQRCDATVGESRAGVEGDALK